MNEVEAGVLDPKRHDMTQSGSQADFSPYKSKCHFVTSPVIDRADHLFLLYTAIYVQAQWSAFQSHTKVRQKLIS